MDPVDQAKTLFFEGIRALEAGDASTAAQRLRAALALAPGRVSILSNLSLALIRLGQTAEARELLQQALRADETAAEVWLNLGVIELDGGNATEAARCFQRATALDGDLLEAWLNHALACNRLKRHDDALTSCREALRRNPASAEAFNTQGATLQELQRRDEALESYAQALRLDPGLAAAHNNRGLLLQTQGDAAQALAAFDAAIRCQPDNAEAHCNRGRALQDLARPAEALAAYEQALKLKPDFTDAINNIFSLHLGPLADGAQIAAWGGRVAAARGRQAIAALRTQPSMSVFRVRHELEQTAHCLAQGMTGEPLRAAHDALAAIAARCPPPTRNAKTIETVAVSADEIDAIAGWRQSAPPVMALPQHCLNPDNDWAAIEAQYFSRTPEIVTIDNMLSVEALQALRQFCLLAPVWSREYRNQYLGAFAADGFVSPLHLQIARELRQRLPRIFGDHPLEQLWGFKYSPQMESGINVHADFARVNLNFWITPDEANLDAESGGLVVYDVPSPPSWSFAQYNHDEQRIYDFLKQHNAQSVRVTHRCNRAVLFNSTLFHETDKIRFRDGYANRRINITYLFGRGLRTA